MSSFTNAGILAELWTEGKAKVFQAKPLLKNIKAATKVKPTKKNPDGLKLGEATFLMPEEFISTSLPDAWGGKDNMWLMIKVDNVDWDNKQKELEEKSK